MIVCVCHRVSDRHIACAVREGCSSFEELQAEVRVGTRCGACRDCARETFERHAAALGGDADRVGVHRIHAGAERRDETLTVAVA